MSESVEPTEVAERGPEPWERPLVPRKGYFECVIATCSAHVERPGICKACSEDEARRQHAPIMRAARESIPSDLRFANFDGPELRLAGQGKGAWGFQARAIGEIKSLFGRALPKALALVGARDAGKTTLACAMLRRMHDQATWDAPHAVVERYRSAYFVSFDELAAELDQWRKGTEYPKLYQRCVFATVLVLDDVKPTRSEEIARLPFLRWGNQSGTSYRPTIYTTWMPEAEAETHFGGGWTKRVYRHAIEVRR